MFSKKTKKRGLAAFTLIEMLIVIVIIGILAAALIPRLASARGRANDVARKADLQQTAAALVAYQIDHGKFPTSDGPLSGINSELIAAGMSSIPTDPNTSRSFDGIANQTIEEGQFGYTPIMKGGLDDNGFVLMAGTETEGGSNWVVTSSNEIDTSTDASSIIPCVTFTIGSSPQNNSGACRYEKNADQLRYIYVY